MCREEFRIPCRLAWLAKKMEKGGKRPKSNLPNFEFFMPIFSKIWILIIYIFINMRLLNRVFAPFSKVRYDAKATFYCHFGYFNKL